jgi:toxin-antitoxin system PIN domain toxin
VQLLDLNLLLYATNSDSSNHAHARAWLAGVMGGSEAIALPWVVILGFLRIATNPRVFARPVSLPDALRVVDGWIARPNVVVLQPAQGHWATLRSLVHASGSGGNLTTDAHLAALAIEHGCELCTTDADFGRFLGLRWRNPLQ